ncbi:MAG: hypothetical protein WD871_01585 [Xanthobacteraceae bacterium]
MRRRGDPHDEPPPRPRRPKEPLPPVPTLGELRRTSCWFWVHCRRIDCHHRAPIALVPLIIRWGHDASSDRLRHAARCTRCGRKGATLTAPSYVDSRVGFQPFPAD